MDQKFNPFSHFWFRFLFSLSILISIVFLLINTVGNFSCGVKQKSAQKTDCKEELLVKPEKKDPKKLNILKEDSMFQISNVSRDMEFFREFEPTDDVGTFFDNNYENRRERAEKVGVKVLQSAQAADWRTLDQFGMHSDALIRKENNLIDLGERLINVTVQTKQNDEVYYAREMIWFEQVDPSKCAVYNFLKYSNAFLMSCLSEQQQNENDYKVLVMGFVFIPNKGLGDDNKLEPFVVDYVDFTKDPETYYKSAIFNVVNTKRGEFVLFLGDKAYYLNMFDVEKLQEENMMDLTYYSADGVDNKTSKKAFLLEFSEEGNYVMYSSALSGGVLDVLGRKSLVVDPACFVETEKSVESPFYNDYVDPFTHSPYKIIRVKNWVGGNAVFEQTVSNSGCVSKEGTINMSIGPDFVECSVDVEYELLGC